MHIMPCRCPYSISQLKNIKEASSTKEFEQPIDLWRGPAPPRPLLLAAVAEEEWAALVPWWPPAVDWGLDLDLAITLILTRRREAAAWGVT